MKQNAFIQRGLLGGLFLVVVALGLIDACAIVVPYTLEGKTTFAFRELQGSTVAMMFLMIITLRAAVLWIYAGWAKRNQIFSVRFNCDRQALLWTIIAAVAGAVFVSIEYILLPSQVSNAIGTWESFRSSHGATYGSVNTILQFAYYALEGLAVIWLADTAQSVGEHWRPNLRVPWGGIVLALFWGGMHYLSKDLATFLFSVPVGLALGSVYSLSQKSAWPPLCLFLVLVIL
jgi:hypothetical protein